MTQTELEIIGPYTPEHGGPFCTRDGKPARIICTDRKGASPVIGLVQDGSMELIVGAEPDGVAITMSRKYDLMNAREVPVAREFWVNEYSDGGMSVFNCLGSARGYAREREITRTIHVREVLPGEE